MLSFPSPSLLSSTYRMSLVFPRPPSGAQALAKELGLRKKDMTDLLTETDDSVSLIAYLKVRKSTRTVCVHVV